MVLWDCNFSFDLDVMNRLGKVPMPLSGYMLNRHTTSLGHLCHILTGNYSRAVV